MVHLTIKWLLIYEQQPFVSVVLQSSFSLNCREDLVQWGTNIAIV